jgi:sec-independent protein translocase protein TatA
MLAFGLGMPEVILVLAVVLILFGAKKLPELARGMGKGIKEFKNATREIQDDLEQAMDADHWTDKTVTKKSDSGD